MTSETILTHFPDIHIFIIQAIDNIILDDPNEEENFVESKSIVLKEILWTLSNFIACGEKMLQILLDYHINQKIS